MTTSVVARAGFFGPGVEMRLAMTAPDKTAGRKTGLNRAHSRDSHECYDVPRYWDLAFSDETRFEADFVDAVVARYLNVDPSAVQVLEIGCGGGRQVIELARRGYDISAIDLNPECVQYTRKRLGRSRLRGDVWQADMADFCVPRSFDLVHCLVNTFRHLTSEASATRHLKCVARCLKPGGLYLLGFHLLPPDALELDGERWTVHARQLRITTTVRVLSFSRRQRKETVRFSLRVTTPSQVLRFRTDHILRIYRADQFRRLLRAVPELKLLDVFDFCYDLNSPRELNDELGDAVFVLQRPPSL